MRQCDIYTTVAMAAAQQVIVLKQWECVLKLPCELIYWSHNNAHCCSYLMIISVFIKFVFFVQD